MSKLQVGDIILLKPAANDVTGKKISEVTNSEFCHAVMVYSVKGDDGKKKKKKKNIRVIELNNNGVQINKRHAIESDENNFNGYVMRLKTINEQSQMFLKQTARGMKKRAIGFDIMGLFVLEEFNKLRKSLHFDQASPYGQADILLIAAEFVNLMKQINLTNDALGVYKEKMHCIQFIYNLFYESGKDCRINLDGGFFLDDLNVDIQAKMKYSLSAPADKIDYLDALLESRLAEGELPALKHLHWLSPIYNGTQRKQALLNYHELLESDIPIASSLITAEDFVRHAANLQRVGYFNIR